MLNLKLALFIFLLTKYYIIVKDCKTIIKAYTCYELFPLFNCLLLFKLISVILVCRFRTFKNNKLCYKELFQFYLSTFPPLPNQKILPVWGYIYSTQYMQMPWWARVRTQSHSPKCKHCKIKFGQYFLYTLYCTWQYKTAVISGILWCNWVHV